MYFATARFELALQGVCRGRGAVKGIHELQNWSAAHEHVLLMLQKVFFQREILFRIMFTTMRVPRCVCCVICVVLACSTQERLKQSSPWFSGPELFG